MRRENVFILVLLCLLAAGCSVHRNSYNPRKKFSPLQLQKDYTLFRNVLEESHPSLYWYTPKDSVDFYFDKGASMLDDSLPEYQFRNVLSYVLAQIHCGHTTVRASKPAIKYSERTRSLMFPLNIKAWSDTVVVTSNISHRDSNITRGVVLRSIDNVPIEQIIDTVFRHISADGYNQTHKYQVISNSGMFRAMYGSLYGLQLKTPIEYIDTSGELRKEEISLASIAPDSATMKDLKKHHITKRQRKKLILRSLRNMRLDTAMNTAFMEVNSFASGNKLRRFFRHAFKDLQKQNVKNLVVDMRGNGGGSVVLSNLLTKYIADEPFKIADSLYALKRRSRYHRYESNYLLNRLFLLFLTHKRADGHLHFTHFENKYFKPKSHSHFGGTIYVLTGGNTFSAAALFVKSVVNQDNVIVIGEETGGGGYGNTAWLIPDVTLPNTKVRFRLPLFRLVIDKDAQKGRGVLPEVDAGPSVEAIRKGEDYKMKKVFELLLDHSKK